MSIASCGTGLSSQWAAELLGLNLPGRRKLIATIVIGATSVGVGIVQVLGHTRLAIELLALTAASSLLFTKRASPKVTTPTTTTSEAAETDEAAAHRVIRAAHLDARCEKYRDDNATFILAHEIAGSPESIPVREKVLRFLYLGEPRRQVLDAIQMLYGEGTPTDIPTLRRTLGFVAEIARVEYRPAPYDPAIPSYLLYVQGVAELLAGHLRSNSYLSSDEARACAAMIVRARKWGFGIYVHAAAEQLGTLLLVEDEDMEC